MPGELPLHPKAASMFPARFPSCEMGTRALNALQEPVWEVRQCRRPAALTVLTARLTQVQGLAGATDLLHPGCGQLESAHRHPQGPPGESLQQ